MSDAVSSTVAGYRKLNHLSVTERGLQTRNRNGPQVLPWDAIQEIAIDRPGIRIRAPGHSEVRINLQQLDNPSSLLRIIAARRPPDVRFSKIQRWQSLPL